MSKEYDLAVQVIGEVETDMSQVKDNIPDSFMEAVLMDTYALSIPEGVFLSAPTSVFSNYSVRDLLLVKSAKSHRFAITLTSKIRTTVMDKDIKTIVQDDIEALATATHICALWEQFDKSANMNKFIRKVIKTNKLTKPALVDMTEMFIKKIDIESVASWRDTLLKNSSEDTKMFNNELRALI